MTWCGGERLLCREDEELAEMAWQLYSVAYECLSATVRFLREVSLPPGPRAARAVSRWAQRWVGGLSDEDLFTIALKRAWDQEVLRVMLYEQHPFMAMVQK